MRDAPTADSDDPLVDEHGPSPGRQEGGSSSIRRWRFADDARAALQACLFAADFAFIALAGVASNLIWGSTPAVPPQCWGYILTGCVFFVLVMQIAGMYRFAALRRHGEHLLRLTVLWTTVLLMLMATIYLTGRSYEYSRGWMLLWGTGGWCALVATRQLAWWAIRRFRGQLITRVAIFGQSSAAQNCARRLLNEGGGEIDVRGVFEVGDLLGGRDHQYTGVLARLGAAATRTDEIVLALPCGEVLDLDLALGALGPRVVDIKVAFDFATPRGGGPLVFAPVWHRPLAGLPTIIKRVLDICASAVLLILFLPLMGVIAVLIKLDSRGPVLFRQRRFGISREPFTVNKFRSMRWEAGADPSAPQARRQDPRTTRVGRFLRRTSLDELPQLFNVLRGDMSLVGPRPHPGPLDDKYAEMIEGYVARHHVKPGITGWAQVNGWRGETDTLEKMERRIEHDIYYVKNWSLLLDLRILLKTATVVFKRRNAY